MIESLDRNVWDKVYTMNENHDRSKPPREDIVALVPVLKESTVKNILDLGCGMGRHTVYLAKQGFQISGFDNSPKGIELAQKWVREEHVTADLRVHDMRERYPYDDNTFDAVVASRVIHHGTIQEIRNIIREISRVLKPGGYLHVSVATQKKQDTECTEIEPNTWVPLNGNEKGLPHHCFTVEELTKELGDVFHVQDVSYDERNHLSLLARKR